MRIADRTLCRENCTFSFKEKIEICRQLEKLKVDVIELPAIENPKTDILFVRTASSFVGSCVLSVCVGMTSESFEQAVQAISAAKAPRLRIEAPVSPVGMEYAAHKKPPKMIEWVSATVAKAKEKNGLTHREASVLLACDIPEKIEFIAKRLPVDGNLYENQKQKSSKELAKKILPEIIKGVEGLTEFENSKIFEGLSGIATSLEIKAKQLFYVMRIALTGLEVTPGGATEIAEILGKEETLARIKKGIELLTK